MKLLSLAVSLDTSQCQTIGISKIQFALSGNCDQSLLWLKSAEQVRRCRPRKAVGRELTRMAMILCVQDDPFSQMVRSFRLGAEKRNGRVRVELQSATYLIDDCLDSIDKVGKKEALDVLGR